MENINDLQVKILSILKNVAPESRTVFFLAQKLGFSTGTIQSRLKMLESVGLVRSIRHGRGVFWENTAVDISVAEKEAATVLTSAD